MLSASDNELLTRVTDDAPMGQMIRRYWIPACLSSEAPDPDGAPVRIKLLGERLVVFRDSDGRVGVIDERCPHRLVSLALGRNEDGGLRCIYHGWKFDVCGNCMDMPTEPPDYGYRDRMKLKSYAAREAGGIVWAYMGPPEFEPPFPEYDWMKLPAAQRAVFKVGERANYLQGVEGAIDSAHSWFLHQGVIWDWKKRASLSTDTSPKLEAEDTSYGMRYAAIRKTVTDPDKQKYVRVTLFVVPITAVIPRPLESNLPAHIQIFVPLDDETTMFYGIFFSQDGSPVSTEETEKKHHVIAGVDLDRNYFKLAAVNNWFNQDREAMKNGSYTGIEGFTNQDMACQETMGPIADRTREHLGTSDIAITCMRRRMLDALRKFQEGRPLMGIEGSIPYERIRSEQKVIPIDQPWQTVGAYAGEYPITEVARKE